MPAFKDLTGQRFGRLTVLSLAGKRKTRTFWHCLCDCGNEKDICVSQLTGGRTVSCGCYGKERRCGVTYDLQGQRFGRLTVLSVTDESKNGDRLWLCRCDCGNVKKVRGSCLKSGETKSCGCLAKETRIKIGASSKGRVSSKKMDLTGQRFGLLTVISEAPKGKGGIRWHCLCDCGKQTITSTAHLRSGHSKSCGCLGLKHATEAKITHGQTKSSLYLVYRSMRSRCENKNTKGYRWYGAKGVKVCDEWKSFSSFQKWAEESGYKKGLTIDRIDPESDYCPENCEWVTRSENSKRMNEHRKKSL